MKSIDKVLLLLDNTAPFGGVPERSKGSDCKSDAKASVVRIHLPPPASWAKVDFCGEVMLPLQPKSVLALVIILVCSL